MALNIEHRIKKKFIVYVVRGEQPMQQQTDP